MRFKTTIVLLIPLLYVVLGIRGNICINSSSLQAVSETKQNSFDNLIRATSSDWLGFFVRGEDFVNITGQLVSPETGEPIPNDQIEVYLNFSSGKSVFIGTFSTNSQGYFNVSFPVLSTYPIGNATVWIYYPGNPLAGFGPTSKLYEITILGKISVDIKLSKRNLASFEKNVKITVSLVMDNGTKLKVESINISLYVKLNTSVEQFNVTTGTDGSFTLIYNFTSEGRYEVQAEFWYNGTNYNAIASSIPSAQYLIAEEQYVVDRTNISGIPRSLDFDSFNVKWACVISARINGSTSLRVLRNYTYVIVSGKYINATGDPEATQLVFTLRGSTFNESYLINTSVDGSFTFLLNITPSFPVGNYILTFNDTDPSTSDFSSILTMTVYTILSVVDVNIGKHYVRAGDYLSISGHVVDVPSGKYIGNASLLIFAKTSTFLFFQQNVLTDSLGRFHVNILIPADLMEPNVTIGINIISPDSRFYFTKNYTTQVLIWRFLAAFIRVNTTMFSWDLIDGAVVSHNASSQLEFFAKSVTLEINITILDNFLRPYNETILCTIEISNISRKNIEIYVSKVIFLQLNETVEIIFRLSVPENEETQKYELHIHVSVIAPEEEITPSPSDLRPIFITLLLALVIAVSFPYFKKLMIPKPREKISEIMRLIDITIDEIDRRNWGKIALNIVRLCDEIGEFLNVKWTPWMTFREFVSHISRHAPKKIASSLNNLVNSYEKIVFADRILSHRELELLVKSLIAIRNWLSFVLKRKER